MKTGTLELSKTEVKFSVLKDDSDNWLQFWYTIAPITAGHIADQIKAIEDAESELLVLFDIDSNSVASKRFFSSDLISHYDEIMNYKSRRSADFFLSITEQPPASGAKIAMLGMCLGNITDKFRDDNIFYFDTTSDIRHIFIEHIIDSDADEHSDSEKQTENIFKYLKEKLLGFNASIKDNVLRTWIYAPHVDADYAGIVKARKELFDSINLTKETHYIASTGIQGGSKNQYTRVFMDAYAVVGVNDQNVRYIQAPEHMSPTHIYGVTFERATGIEMGPVDFLFISGTASIDKEGKIVHPGNIEKQTERTLENISAVLESAGFKEEHLSSFIVYLRDQTDYNYVKPKIEQYSEKLPTIYVKASVCRPGWLIEIEATAAKLK